MVSAGDEVLDLVEHEVQHVLIESLQHMVDTWQLDVLRARDVLGQIAPLFDPDCGIAHAM